VDERINHRATALRRDYFEYLFRKWNSADHRLPSALLHLVRYASASGHPRIVNYVVAYL